MNVSFCIAPIDSLSTHNDCNVKVNYLQGHWLLAPFPSLQNHPISTYQEPFYSLFPLNHLSKTKQKQFWLNWFCQFC